MVTAVDRPAAEEHAKVRRPYRWAFVAGLVVAAAVGVALVAGGGGEEEPAASAQDVVARIGDAIERSDPEKYAGLSHVGLGQDLIWEDNMNLQIDILKLDPVVHDCETAGHGVRCTVAMGDDYFYSAVLGENVEITITALVGNTGRFAVTTWPPGPDILAVEVDMQAWIRRIHPELEELMFDVGGDLGPFKWDEEAYRLHMQYLDEYMAYRDGD